MVFGGESRERTKFLTEAFERAGVDTVTVLATEYARARDLYGALYAKAVAATGAHGEGRAASAVPRAPPLTTVTDLNAALCGLRMGGGRPQHALYIVVHAAESLDRVDGGLAAALLRLPGAAAVNVAVVLAADAADAALAAVPHDAWPPCLQFSLDARACGSLRGALETAVLRDVLPACDVCAARRASGGGGVRLRVSPGWLPKMCTDRRSRRSSRGGSWGRCAACFS